MPEIYQKFQKSQKKKNYFEINNAFINVHMQLTETSNIWLKVNQNILHHIVQVIYMLFVQNLLSTGTIKQTLFEVTNKTT